MVVKSSTTFWYQPTLLQVDTEWYVPLQLLIGNTQKQKRIGFAYICLPENMSRCCCGGMPSFSSTRSLIRSTLSVGSISISISFPVSVWNPGQRNFQNLTLKLIGLTLTLINILWFYVRNTKVHCKIILGGFCTVLLFSIRTTFLFGNAKNC